MLCPKCGADNSGEAKFCDQCSAPLLIQCPLCAALNRPVAKFCGACAASLQASAQVKPAAPLPELRHVDGERRHLSVLFCDIAGSTALASHLDAEEFREIVTRYHTAARQAVVRFGGEVAHYLGDGLLVYFGYPQAHEDDAWRAVMAGLQILENVAELNRNLAIEHRPTLSVRIGIHAGSAVVGEGSGKEADVYGDVPNLAARVQNAAAPDSVFITADVHQLVAGLFVVDDQGEQRLKGIERAVRLYRIKSATGARGRLTAAASRGLTPFIGREDELRLLLSRWEQAREGEGQAIVVVGEPGIGKSRLLQRFHEQIAGAAHTWIDCAALALHQNTPFFAIAGMLQDCVRRRAEQKGGDRTRALEDLFAAAGLKVAEAVPLIAPLLDLEVSTRYPPLTLTPEQQRKRLLATMALWALGTARLQPLIIAMEDLHWADPSTLEAIHLVGEQCHSAPLLLICTARPEFRAPWPLRAYHAVVTLNRLSARNAREMVAKIAAAALQPATIDALVERSGGVPLYVEELTRSIVERGGTQSSADEIPATLHDSLMARLDRLGAAREIAQLAAVIGHDFSWPLLSAVSAVDDRQLENALENLSDAEVIFASGVPPEANYRFKHALLQDVAYQSLLRVKRQQYHRRIGEVLEQRFPEVATARPELLAHHYTQAELYDRATLQWQAAAQKASERSAHTEAVSHLTRALEMLKKLPEGPSRAQLELAMQISLGVSLMLTRGYAAAEVEKAYKRARDLYRQVGERPQFFAVLFGLWAFYSVRADFNTAHELGEQLVSLAENAHDRALLLEAHTARGNTLCFSGELLLAREHLEKAIALYDPQQHRSHAFLYGQDPGVHSLSYEALSLWLLGYPDQARRRSAEAFTLAQQLCHPYSLAFALIHILYLHRFSCEVNATLERANELFLLAAEHGFPIPLAVGTVHQGWALTEQGEAHDGIEKIHHGIQTWRATGSTLFFQPFLLGMLAEAHWKAGSPKEGLTALSEALAVVNTTGERFWEAELYRLKGELTLLSDGQGARPDRRAEAEELFRKAADIARRQNARALELRAVMSLCRLWRGRGTNPEGRQMLADIYNWFTEGLETADLRMAGELLKQ